jgi:aldehyde dehydrogenase
LFYARGLYDYVQSTKHKAQSTKDSAMQLTDQVIGKVVQEVLAEIGKGRAPNGNGHAQARRAAGDPKAGRFGVYENVNDAVAAATEAQRTFERRGMDDRARAVDCIRRIVIDQAETLGRDEFEETKIGRLDHKIEKLIVAGKRIPGVEFFRTEAYSGGYGITLTEYAPFGVVGVVTPVTHSLPTLAGNAINILAAGNSLVCNPHPSGARIACKGVELFNRAIAKGIGIDNLITIIANPTLESAQAIFDHRSVRLLLVTGGPAVGRAAMRSNKRAIVAGPGNPPVVVDETANLDNAATSIIQGGAYDNNLLCIGEKEVFAVASIFDELMAAMEKSGAIRLDNRQIEQLTKAAFVYTGEDKSKLTVNKDFIGQDPAVLAERSGFKLPKKTDLIFGETDERNPFVEQEQMMPFVPFVRVPDVDTAIALAKKYEHGFKHTAIIHSRNLETVTRMGRELDTTLFIVNGPCMAGLGSGGEGYLSYSIATPTGEGVTTPLTFTRQRRASVVGSMRIL